MSNKSTYKNATEEKEQEYAEKVPELECLKVFSLVLPRWAAENQKDIGFIIQGRSQQADG